MYAEDLMGEPFVCSYSDILFTADVVKRLLANPADIALSVDTRLARPLRAPHRASAGRRRESDRRQRPRHALHRGIDPSAAHGEYIGIAKFSAAAPRR